MEAWVPVDMTPEEHDAEWAKRVRPKRPGAKVWQRPWQQGIGARTENVAVGYPQILYSDTTTASTYTDASAILNTND